MLNSLMDWWDAVINYYKSIGEKYRVDPTIFVGIHIIATPLFILATAWIIRNFHQRKSIVLPVAVAALVFNAASIYLIFAGKNLPWWIYTVVAVTTLISCYFSYKRVRRRMMSGRQQNVY